MIHIWRLSAGGKDNLGLCCSEDGLVLGTTPLIERRDSRFVVREQHEIERLLDRGYRDYSQQRRELDVDRLMPGLATVATALNANDPCLACIAAVHLRLPDLPDQFARSRMEAEDVLIKSAPSDGQSVNWDPALHPRTGTPPNPGWFAPTDGSADETPSIQTAANDNPTVRSDASQGADGNWVRLRAGPSRIDELADFVEWLANARPEDEPAIRAEIKRYFYDVGDQGSANALNSALSVVLRPGTTEDDRQKILDSLDVFTRADPAAYAQTRDAVILGTLLLGGIPSGAAADLPSAAWKLGWAARGNYFSEQLGADLPATFRTIDSFSNGIATSIKSIDLNAATYRDAARLTYRLNAYIDSIATYDGSVLGAIQILPANISGRALSLAIPKGSMTAVQRAAIDAARIRAQAFGVNLIITEF
ncbi:MAG TPA: hypothetical protein VMF32_15755 [Xanthobacteraceae bacterium]|nr:hypothetical protein [Xanthobacteraceae bacterium]